MVFSLCLRGKNILNQYLFRSNAKIKIQNYIQIDTFKHGYHTCINGMNDISGNYMGFMLRLIILRLRTWAYNRFGMPEGHIKKRGHNSLFFSSVYICQSTNYNCACQDCLVSFTWICWLIFYFYFCLFFHRAGIKASYN